MMNQDKKPLKVETKKCNEQTGEKNIQKIIPLCSWSVDVTALLTKVEQESVGRMLQRAAERNTGVSQLRQYVGQTDDSEIYGGPHVILSDEGEKCFH
jgi:hypothetical protein